ncbi:signal peptide protein [Rhodopirellula maiorica SM1]|uniref:Signal peptide protein n=1 Tax=Rhodopirellula maiorica SM1 TaxID=1265738 RepID=M5RKP8_9BACT|nr:hypothetical protein [Rhodopirellula maiorica]EMI19880.1 signal peptide protein [Rhodopirellula maiorica SM1]
MKLMFSFVGLCLFIAGCNPATETAATQDGNAAEQSQFISATEPEGAMAVGDARQSVEDDQSVTLVGLIGGSSKPFVEGLAAFTIVDAKVPYCAPDEGCPTPWDYCCETNAVKDNIATVKVVDENGKPVASDARELLNVKELSTVVVQGTAKRDDQGNLTVAASKVYVRPE